MLRRWILGRKCARFMSTSNIGINVENSGAITSIGINNVSKKNCLNIDLIKQLKQAFTEFDASDSKIAILYGEGGTFCSGFDVNEVLKLGHNTFVNETVEWMDGPLCRKPIICALNGYAVGEGFELALACDFRVIEDTAHLGFLGRRFGVPNAFGGGRRLVSMVGQSRAMDLVITGRLINGRMAGEWGLAAKEVATGTAFGQSLNLASSITKIPQRAIYYDRYSMMKDEWKNSNVNKIIDDESIERVYDEMDVYLPKFTEGLGRHGTSRNIVKKQLKSWEDDELEQIKENT